MQNPIFFGLDMFLFIISFCIAPLYGENATAVKVDVGIILDLDTYVGKISRTCMLMAIEDFYTNHNYSTRIVTHLRNSNNDDVDAASAAIDLLKNVQVQAILGPQRSTQADFVIDLGNKVNVPIISPSSTPSLSPKESPYFIRSAPCSSFQAKAIAGIVKAFGWREVVFIYQDNNYGSGIVPFLTDAMLEIDAFVPYQSIISPSATDEQILQELYKLKTMQTQVFVVHMLPCLASSFFLRAKEAEMMTKGYAWIIADVLTSLLDSVDSIVIDAMQGVIGVKAHVPKSNKLSYFTKRWRKKFQDENPDTDNLHLNVYGLWAYDMVTALATAVDKVGAVVQQFKKPVTRENSTDLDAIGTSNMGPTLVDSVRNINFKGLSGDFHVTDGQLQPSAYEIVNVIGNGDRTIGYWTEQHGISKTMKPNGKAVYSTDKDNLAAIVWPGFCIDVFKEVVKSLPYLVPYEFIPFATPDGQSAGTYDELVYQIFLEKYDAVVGDVTIVANRSRFVDFTLPFTESGVSTIVPIKNDERKNAWIFMKPLTKDLWLTIGGFFIYTGFVVWVLEHRVNKEFRGPPSQQIGMIFWFSFSTLVFAHKEKVVNNLSRFVVIVWVFVVLVLTSSYTASLTSMLTVQQLQPSIYDLIKNGEYVGYHSGSFIPGLLMDLKFDSSKFRNYSTYEEYNEALSRGSRNGGVAAIVDELPYIRPFLAKHCSKYAIVGPTYKAAGFGFAFPKGSPLVPEFSRAILNVTEGEKMVRISREWFGEEEGCPGKDGTVITSNRLSLDSFKGLFLTAGVSSSCALIIYLSIFFYENRIILASGTSITQKLSLLAKTFDEENNKSSEGSKKQGGIGEGDRTAESIAVSPDFPRSPAVSTFYHLEGVFSQEEGFSTTEPGTPYHDMIQT
ncbi:glutamate receptor -like [Olea europaea subsp. europaea]|uniref:Glutamate receptor n=1 Tax=Olea europaea subsp. europaea TaxID=158383 RepID=A0A8S0QEQ9_OLEEU|nr:glutamate receptor -like [Olea europaea subsp. europaea]